MPEVLGTMKLRVIINEIEHEIYITLDNGIYEVYARKKGYSDLCFIWGMIAETMEFGINTVIECIWNSEEDIAKIVDEFVKRVECIG